MKPVFVATSAFVALADRRDKNHGPAKRFLRNAAKKRIALVTSTDVLDELVTLVRYRIDHASAVTVGESLLRSKLCRLLDVGDATREAAWQIFVRYADQTFSFTDCTSFALMRALGADTAFTFDRRDFHAAGFATKP
jgi:predicted nucleic acid-binding protein